MEKNMIAYLRKKIATGIVLTAITLGVVGCQNPNTGAYKGPIRHMESVDKAMNNIDFDIETGGTYPIDRTSQAGWEPP
jgi:hypothetical protein